jgi:hypothetical protein
MLHFSRLVHSIRVRKCPIGICCLVGDCYINGVTGAHGELLDKLEQGKNKKETIYSWIDTISGLFLRHTWEI